MAQAEGLFESLQSAKQEPRTATPNKDLDGLVQEIFDQAREHRKKLITFYTRYTAILSALVMILIFWQAAARLLVYGDKTIELIPSWALNLVVAGMFGQFIGLLTIVTNRVWEFKPFLDHAQRNDKHRTADTSSL